MLGSGSQQRVSTRRFEPSLIASVLAWLLIVTAARGADPIARAKRGPGKLSYATTGAGGPPHLAAEMLKQAAGFDMLMVPYSGTGDVNVALLRGDVDIALGATAAVAPLLQQKDVKALAV